MCDSQEREDKFRCIFCKDDSSKSRSVEHIIPEALGNTDHVLPPGIVCDRCNNYFARKVEGPFLGTPRLRDLRARQRLLNKRGLPTTIDAVLPQIPMLVDLRFDEDGQIGIGAKRERDEPAFIKALISGRVSRLIVPLNHELPTERLMARLVAKISIEFMAARVLGLPNWEELIVDDPQLDAIRRFARIGDVPDFWPLSVRQIYDENACSQSAGVDWQILHEFDFLVTEQHELYGVFCFFGIEIAINIGGPEIQNYKEWLDRHDGHSPLYRCESVPAVPPRPANGKPRRAT
jgi:HNH endonuclease